VNMAGNGTLRSTTSGSISFVSTVDGPAGLTLDPAGTATVGAAVATTTSLDSLTTTSTTGKLQINGGLVKTLNGQTNAGPVSLGGTSDVTLNSTSGTAAISFGAAATIDGPKGLIVTNGGTTTLNAAVGGNSALDSFSTTSTTGTLQINGGSIKTLNGQTYAGPVRIGAAA